METTLGLTCEEISFEEIWAKSPPAEANGLSLPEFINPVSLHSILLGKIQVLIH